MNNINKKFKFKFNNYQKKILIENNKFNTFKNKYKLMNKHMIKV